MMTTLSIRRILLKSSGLVALAGLLGALDANSQGTNTVVSHGKSYELKPTFEGTPTSFTRRGNDAFSVGYYVKDGAIVKKNSLFADEEGLVSQLDLDVAANGEGFSSVIAKGKGTMLNLSGSISASDSGEGKNASDFSGLGALIIASDHATVNVNAMKLYTKGFLRAAFISDNHAQVLVKDTTVTAMGANPLTQAYKGYANCADQNVMISPPWVLGIQGGVRPGNMLGERSTLTVVNSKITSGGWAVLSVDAGTSPMMNVVDTTLEILPESQGGMSSGKFSYSSRYGSGYGTYFTGNAKENFYGVTFKGLTYAGIFTGGEGTYRSSKGTIKLADAEGNALEPVAGKGKPTVIEAVWGFMNHGSAIISLLDGTVVNTEEAVFLCKAGGASFIVDNAVLNPASGILLQMMHNDDHIVGGSMKAFNTDFNEAPGWPSASGNVTKKGATSVSGRGAPPNRGPGGPNGAPPNPPPDGQFAGGPPPGHGGGPPGMPSGSGGSSAVKLLLTTGSYKGNVLNGSGYYNQSGRPLEVTIGKSATLEGVISLTETRHIDETRKQNTRFTINEYYYLGHVTNRNFRNGTSTLEVGLKDGGKWTVTGESLISKLVVGNGIVEGANGAKLVMTIDGKETPIKQGETYSGNVVVLPVQQP